MAASKYHEWLLLIAICLCLMAISAVIDISLRKSEVRKIHDWIYRISIKIDELPFKELQIRICHKFFRLLYYLGPKYASYENVIIIEVKNTDYNDDNSDNSAGLTLLAFIFVIFTIIYSINNIWMFKIVLVPFSLLYIFGFLVIGDELYYNILNNRLGSLFVILVTSSTFSCIVNWSAIFISLHIPYISNDNKWFGQYSSVIGPLNPFTMAADNYIFDFITIAIVYKSLKFIINNKKYFVIIMLLNTVTSFILAILLYSSFKLIDGTVSLMDGILVITKSFKWFIGSINGIYMYYIKDKIIILQSLYDIQLMPIVLTTFMPVFIISICVITLSIIKPPVMLASRIFAGISEKEESVFRQLSFTFTLIAAAAKAIYDYLIVT